MIQLLEDFSHYVDDLYAHWNIKHNIHEDVMIDIGQFKYEEYDIDSENKDSDYIKSFSHLTLLLDEYEKWTENDNSIKLMWIFKQNEYEDEESNKWIDEAKK